MKIDGKILRKVDNSDIQNDGKFLIPNEIEIIGDSAFKNNDKILEIVCSKNIKAVEKYAFYFSKNLKTCVFENDDCTIEQRVFMGCQQLTNIVLPKNLKKLNNSIFCFCANLEHVDIPNSVKEIGPCVFQGCTSLQEIWIPDGVKEIKEEQFCECINLKKIHWRNHIYSYEDLKEYKIIC